MNQNEEKKINNKTLKTISSTRCNKYFYQADGTISNYIHILNTLQNENTKYNYP